MTRITAAATLAILLLATATPAAEDPATPQPVTPRSADAAFRAGDHAEAARQYKVLLDADATKLGAWYRLGVSLLGLGHHSDAANAFEKAAGAPRIAASARYNQACALSLAGKADAAVAALAEAVEAGFVDALQMEADADLDTAREAAGFPDVLTAARAARRAVPKHQFDFWVGSWEVRDAKGTLLGTNEITLRQKGRIVHESWTSAGGGTGESINFYDPGRGMWRQVWVSDQGGVAEYEGGYEDGAMRMQGRKTLSNGTTSLARATFFENDDGTVRQLLEQSTDGGLTWSASFDGTYTRVTK